MYVTVGPQWRLRAKNWCFWIVVLEKTWDSLGQQKDQTSQSWRKSTLNFYWRAWCWSWNSNTLATWCKEPTHWKRPWCWERLKAGGEGDDRGWDGRVTSLTQRTWVWANSGRWWRTGKPGMLQFMGSQRVGHDWVTELNWTEKLIKLRRPPEMRLRVCLQTLHTTKACQHPTLELLL